MWNVGRSTKHQLFIFALLLSQTRRHSQKRSSLATTGVPVLIRAVATTARIALNK